MCLWENSEFVGNWTHKIYLIDSIVLVWKISKKVLYHSTLVLLEKNADKFASYCHTTEFIRAYKILTSFSLTLYEPIEKNSV